MWLHTCELMCHAVLFVYLSWPTQNQSGYYLQMLGVTRVTGSQIITRLNNYFFVNEQYFFSRTIVIIRATKKIMPK